MNLRSRIFKWGVRGLAAVFFPKHHPTSPPAFQKLEPGVVWCHASSAGELEALWPVILKLDRDHIPMVITVLSASGAGSIEKLKSELIHPPVWMGHSPKEGWWLEWIEMIQPKIFLTYRYEAWPELWIALSESNVSLFIVAARVRRSLRLVQMILGIVGTPLPQIFYLTVNDSDSLDLLQTFKNQQGGVKIQQLGDPRWDRVLERKSKVNPNVTRIASIVDSRPRPIGILGSVWPQDLEIIGPELSKIPGTLLVVPHSLHPENLTQIENKLRLFGLRALRISQSGFVENANSLGPGQNVLMVDEMGYLSELYRLANWVYVGGGFLKGVHSTIEPALHCVPISVGPVGVGKFPEIELLQRIGVLKVIHSVREFESFIKSYVLGKNPIVDPERWNREVKLQLGASARIVQTLEHHLKTC